MTDHTVKSLFNDTAVDIRAGINTLHEAIAPSGVSHLLAAWNAYRGPNPTGLDTFQTQMATLQSRLTPNMSQRVLELLITRFLGATEELSKSVNSEFAQLETVCYHIISAATEFAREKNEETAQIETFTEDTVPLATYRALEEKLRNLEQRTLVGMQGQECPQLGARLPTSAPALLMPAPQAPASAPAAPPCTDCTDRQSRIAQLEAECAELRAQNEDLQSQVEETSHLLGQATEFAQDLFQLGAYTNRFAGNLLGWANIDPKLAEYPMEHFPQMLHEYYGELTSCHAQFHRKYDGPFLQQMGPPLHLELSSHVAGLIARSVPAIGPPSPSHPTVTEVE